MDSQDFPLEEKASVTTELRDSPIEAAAQLVVITVAAGLAVAAVDAVCYSTDTKGQASKRVFDCPLVFLIDDGRVLADM